MTVRTRMFAVAFVSVAALMVSSAVDDSEGRGFEIASVSGCRIPPGDVTSEQASATRGQSRDRAWHLNSGIPLAGSPASLGVEALQRDTWRQPTGILYRTASVDKRAIDEDARTIRVVFSTEYPVRRFFGTEILDHRKKSVRLGWLAGGRAPYLVDHRTSDRVGVIERAAIDAKAREGRATVRFGRSERATEVFNDYIDGIRSSVSVGYVVHEAILESFDDDQGETWRVTDWEPLEISDAALPADPNASARALAAIRGFPHGADDLEAISTVFRGRDTASSRGEDMHDDDFDESGPGKARRGRFSARDAHRAGEQGERQRAEEIRKFATRFNCRELGDRWIAAGRSVESFKGHLLTEVVPEGKPLETPLSDLGMSDREARRYSVSRAILAHSDKNWDEAGLEREASREIEKRLDKPARGFFVPVDAFRSQRARMVREQSKGVAGAGGDLVGTEHLSGSFIELRRNRVVALVLGARLLAGLRGDVQIPRQSGATTAQWIDTDTTAGGVGASDIALDQVQLTPHSVAGKTVMTRKLLLQSSPDIEALVQDDLLQVLGLAIDAAVLKGSGVGEEPLGILGTTGVGVVPIGANGGNPNWDHLVALETEIATGNADDASLAFVTTPEGRGKLRRTQKFVDTDGTALWESGRERGMGRVIDYPAMASKQLPADLTKGSGTGLSAMVLGDFNDILIGEWGVLDLLPDPITFADTGALVLRAFQDVDIALRHPESFAVINDAVTT